MRLFKIKYKNEKKGIEINLESLTKNEDSGVMIKKEEAKSRLLVGSKGSGDDYCQIKFESKEDMINARRLLYNSGGYARYRGDIFGLANPKQLTVLDREKIGYQKLDDTRVDIMKYINERTGAEINLESLTENEKEFYNEAFDKYQKNEDWWEFHLFALTPKSPIYTNRKSHQEILQHPLYCALKDMWIELGIQQGEVAPDDED